MKELIPFSKRLVGVLVLISANGAAAQELTTQSAADIRGLRHVLAVSIKSDPASPLFPPDSKESRRATLTVKIRISAHSREANFFGDVRTTLSDFDPVEGSRQQEVWKDASCHHERGFPKITVLDVGGAIATGQKKHVIAARSRQLGLGVPDDEVMQGRRLASGVDDVGHFNETRTATRFSRLFVDLKLYILPCNLVGRAD